MNRNHLLLAAIVVALMCAAPMALDSSEADGAEKGDFLLDYGNGWSIWIQTSPGSTVADTVKATLDAAGLPHNDDLSEIDSQSAVTIGSTSGSGSFSEPGTTGVTVTSQWRFFAWSGSEWTETAASDAYSSQKLAAAFYPEGIVPVETPERQSSWTAINGDSWNSANQIANLESEAGKKWEHVPEYGGDDPNGLYGGCLVVRDHVLVKYGNASKITGQTAVTCYNLETGAEEWSFYYNPNGMDTSSMVVMGQYVYVQSNNGHIYRIDWREGPGADNSKVITFGGKPWDDETVVPWDTIEIDWYVSFGNRFASMVADSGSIYVKSYNGMQYCFDKDLNLVWSFQSEGHAYYNTSTIFDGHVFAGFYDGCLYILDQKTGALEAKTVIYQQTESFKGKSGCANVPQVFKDDTGYTIFITSSDGLGMDSKYSGFGVYHFDGTQITEVKNFKGDLGSTGAYITRMDYLTEYEGAMVATDIGFFVVNKDGTYTKIFGRQQGYEAAHNAPVLVNGSVFYYTTYTTHNAVSVDMTGTITGMYRSIGTYSMVSPVVVDGYALPCDDDGVICFGSTLAPYDPNPPVPESSTPLWQIIAYVLIAIAAFFAILWVVLRFGLKWENPFGEMKRRVRHFFFGTEFTHNKRSKRKVRAVVIFGVSITLLVALASLCLGSETTMGPLEALSNAISAIQKGGSGLTYEEMLIYNQRLPRVLAAIAVGMGLSVAGAMYQAVIKNPLVEPYIMGVSSGAGTFAVLVLTSGFTFFGLFALNSPYLIAFCAIFGGLLAFGLTMLLALKTGGKSINYVLAGIVIGLVFSAVQSLMMMSAGTKVASALSWLYGSFASMTWDKLWLVLIPAIFICIIPLIWAKEFNLVLLGEDQAKQMGLNAKRFDAVMLIIASVLTSICVAFCGVIGFVGLVIPHLSRMILGGDHRLMLPATMAFGGFLMVAADLLARTLLSGYELPVGAITTAIGVPVFAYLLITRGRSYDVRGRRHKSDPQALHRRARSYAHGAQEAQDEVHPGLRHGARRDRVHRHALHRADEDPRPRFRAGQPVHSHRQGRERDDSGPGHGVQLQVPEGPGRPGGRNRPIGGRIRIPGGHTQSAGRPVHHGSVVRSRDAGHRGHRVRLHVLRAAGPQLDLPRGDSRDPRRPHRLLPDHGAGPARRRDDQLLRPVGSGDRIGVRRDADHNDSVLREQGLRRPAVAVRVLRQRHHGEGRVHTDPGGRDLCIHNEVRQGDEPGPPGGEPGPPDGIERQALQRHDAHTRLHTDRVLRRVLRDHRVRGTRGPPPVPHAVRRGPPPGAPCLHRSGSGADDGGRPGRQDDRARHRAARRCHNHFDRRPRVRLPPLH